MAPAITWTEPDRKTAPLMFEATISALEANVGKRARVTFPNGARKSGALSWLHLAGKNYVALGGSLCGGEYDGAVSVEIMERGRYRPVFADLERR